MHGWRTTMEDAILTEPFLRLPEVKLQSKQEEQKSAEIVSVGEVDMSKGVQLYGVYDGHGGNEVSAYIRDNLVTALKDGDYFKDDRMELALEKAYQQIDI